MCVCRSLMGGESVAQSFTHIIVDEVHERDKLSDFLLTVLKDMLERFVISQLVLRSRSVFYRLQKKVGSQLNTKSMAFYNVMYRPVPYCIRYL